MMDAETVAPDDLDQFRVGQVWRSPKGTLYVVEQIGPERSNRERLFGKKKQATLRQRVAEKGRRVRRDYDAIIGWAFVSTESHVDSLI